MTMAGTKQQGFSALAMARALGRSFSTITREFERNTLPACKRSANPTLAPSMAAC